MKYTRLINGGLALGLLFLNFSGLIVNANQLGQVLPMSRKSVDIKFINEEAIDFIDQGENELPTLNDEIEESNGSDENANSLNLEQNELKDEVLADDMQGDAETEDEVSSDDMQGDSEIEGEALPDDTQVNGGSETSPNNRLEESTLVNDKVESTTDNSYSSEEKIQETSVDVETKASGIGLVQLFQVVPSGQESKEGKSTSEILGALQCKPNHNLYPASGISQHKTYVNSCYVDDAMFLGEEGDYYRIYISGYEGKVPKKESHYFEVDLNGDGKKVKYEIQTVAYFVPEGTSKQSEDATIISNVESLDYANQYLKDYVEMAHMPLSYSTGTVQSPSYYVNQNGTLIHYLSKNVKKANYYSTTIIGKAPSWMSQGVKYYSYDGVYFYSDWRQIKVSGKGAVNQNNPFYNYYQYLPFRSKSNYSQTTINEYTASYGYTALPTSSTLAGNQSSLVNAGGYFENVQDLYGINGGLQYAMAIHESGWGRSSLSVNKNNLFGMNATDNNPYGNGTSFPTVKDGIYYHADRYLSWGYTDPISDYRYHGSHVGNKGSGMNVSYASDPFWGEKIAGWYYRFDQASGLKDYNYYTIGIKQSTDVIDVLSDLTSSAKVLYQTWNKYSKMKLYNYPVLITGASDGYYKIKTDTPIVNGSALFNGKYDWKKTYGYIKQSSVKVINGTNYHDPATEYIGSLSSVKWLNSTQLEVSGYGEVVGMSFPSATSVTHTIVLVNRLDGKEYRFKMIPQYDSWLATDPHQLGGDYAYASYKGIIDFNILPNGRFDAYHEVSSQGKIQRYILSNSSRIKLPVAKKTDTTSTEITDYLSGEEYPVLFRKIAYVGRYTTLKWSNNNLYIEGYGELGGFSFARSSDVDHSIVLINKETKKEYIYSLSNQYDSWLENDPHKLGGNFAYGRYKGTIDINKIENGEYDLYHQIKVSGETHRYALYNSAGLELPVKQSFNGNLISLGSNQVGSNLSVNLIKKTARYVGRITDIKWDYNQVSISGYGQFEGMPLVASDNVKHEIVFVNRSNKKEYSFKVSTQYDSWLGNDPHKIGGDFSYGRYSGSITVANLPQGQYDMYHQTTVNSRVNRAPLYNNARVQLPSKKTVSGSLMTFSDYLLNGDRIVSVTLNNPTYVGRLIHMKWNDNQLDLSGYGELEGFSFATLDSVKHDLVFLNESNKQRYDYSMRTQYDSWLANDPHKLGANYGYGSYSGKVSIDKLPKGRYKLYHQLTIGNQVFRFPVCNAANVSLPAVKTINGITYEVKNSDSTLNYSIFIDIK